MSSRKVHVSKNTKTADEKMLTRFRNFIKKPYTDPLLDYTLDPININQIDNDEAKKNFIDKPDTDPLILFYLLSRMLIGLVIIAFIRVLRPLQYDSNGNLQYQDIIYRTMDNQNQDSKQLKLYSYSSYKSSFSVLLNALRRFGDNVVQSEIIKNYRNGTQLPNWAADPKDFMIWSNVKYGAVEAVYRRITDYLFKNSNKGGKKVSKYLPSRSFMDAFRELESRFLSGDYTPYDLQIYIVIRLSAIYPGRSGTEMGQWMKTHIIVRDYGLLISVPRGWKNTKHGHKIKSSIKIAADDPLVGAMQKFILSRPSQAPPNLFLRPLDRWKVSYYSVKSN